MASTRIMPATSPNCWGISARCSGSLACRFCWCITRARTLRTVLPPVRDCAARAISTPSATRTCISGEPKEHLILSSEHRAAPAAAPVYLELVATDAETTHLEVIASP